MTAAKFWDPASASWETIPAIEGPQGPQGPQGPAGPAGVPVGAPIPWLVAVIPGGYLEFNGQAITQAAQPILFGLYGANLPDLQNRFLMGASGAHPVGELGGQDAVTLTSAQSGMPDHEHHMQGLNLGGAPPATVGNAGKTLISGRGGAGSASSLPAPVASSGFFYGIGVAGAVGGAKNAGASHENKPLYRAVRWITVDG